MLAVADQVNVSADLANGVLVVASRLWGILQKSWPAFWRRGTYRTHRLSRRVAELALGAAFRQAAACLVAWERPADGWS
jgi:hypothetical protein